MTSRRGSDEFSLVPKLKLLSLLISIEKHVIPAGIHVRLSCLTPFGLMQIRSRRICAGIQATWTYTARHPWHWIPLPGGYDALLKYLCITTSTLRGNAIKARYAVYGTQRVRHCVPTRRVGARVSRRHFASSQAQA